MNEETRQEIQQMIDDAIKNHRHNSADSLRIQARDLDKAPQAAIADPTGGTPVDAEARDAIDAIIDRLEDLGLILPS